MIKGSAGLYKIAVVILVLSLLIVAMPAEASNGLTSGFVKIKDWDKTNEAFSFSTGQVAWGSGDFFISPRGIHVFESPGIIDMGLVYLDDIGEAPASGYVEMAMPIDGHTYVVRSQGKYGKFYLEETYDWLDPVQYGISWVYQTNGARSLGGAASTGQPATSGQTGTAAATGCTYEQYITAYNKLTSLMSQGKGDTPEAQAAYAEYTKVKACYESGGSATSSPATSGQTGTVGESGCTYQDYITAYNKLNYLNTHGQANTPESKLAYEQYARIKACYDSTLTGTSSTTTTPTTPTTTTPTTTIPTTTIPTTTPITSPTATVSGQQQLYPVADGEVYAYSYRNWNRANSGLYANMGAGWDPTGGEKRSYLRFAVPSDVGISRAVLKLYQTHNWGPVHQLGVYRVTGPWEEGDDTYHSGQVEKTADPGELCWMQQPSFDTTLVSTFISAAAGESGTAPSWVQVDITPMVQQWQAGTPNYGLVIKTTKGNPTANDPVAKCQFRTKESPDPQYRPVLEISTGGTAPPVSTSIPTPTPAGTALIAESRTVMTGSTVQVPVYFQNAQNVGSLGFTLSYDPAVVQVVKVSKGSLLAPATFTSSVQSDSIIFGFASPQAISGNGSAAVVEFKALGSAGSKSPLTLSEILATSYSGSSLTVSAQNGELTIGQKQSGDADGDGKLSVLDALIALKMYVQSLPLDMIADINKDGRVTPEDARLILEKAKPQ